MSIRMKATPASSALSSGCQEHPFVSILVCTTGNRAALGQCLETLTAQGCQRSEILLVLNGEFDPAFPQRMAAYPVRLLHEPRRGVSIARNTGFRQARGEIVALVDDDVVADSDWLHELVKGFQDPAIACVTGRVLAGGSAGDGMQRMFLSEQGETARFVEPGPNPCRDVLSSVIGVGCNMAFRKHFLENCASFPEDLGAGSVIGLHDEPYLFLQVLRHGGRIYYTQRARVTHSLSEEELAHSKSRLQARFAGTVAFRLKLIVEENGCRWAALKNMSVSASRALRACLGGKDSTQSPAMLSPFEKLRAYLRGPSIYLRSRQSRRRTK
ncbi:MAG: glycosyltransferase [Acidobacteria bacterium]|nr:glycosyltransferase [Acidobacteriota bacterium]